MNERDWAEELAQQVVCGLRPAFMGDPTVCDAIASALRQVREEDLQVIAEHYGEWEKLCCNEAEDALSDVAHAIRTRGHR